MNETVTMVEKAVGKPGDNKLTPAILREPLHLIQKKLPLRVLSKDDFKHWQTYGFVVVKQAVPAANVEALKKLLWEFQEMDPNDMSTWNAAQLRNHAMKELNNSGMVEIYNHQALWDNRQEQRLYDAFVDIWDDEKLWVTIDRANLNTPNKSGGAFGGFIHADVDTTLDPLPVNVQGVLSLVDVDGETGGFQSTVDSLVAAPLPGTAWHQPAAGGRGRQAQEEEIRQLPHRLLPYRAS
jgi:hypothetical protein